MIEKTILKSERFLSAFEKEIQDLEEVIAKEPKSLIKPKEPDPIIENVKELPTNQENSVGYRYPKRLLDFGKRFRKIIRLRRNLRRKRPGMHPQGAGRFPFMIPH